jgi:hypothetical protein
MRRVVLLLVVLVLAGGGYWLARTWMAPAVPNQSLRPLTSAEQAQILPQICAGASAGSNGYAHNCTGLPGYPSDDYGGAGLGLGITLTSIAAGQLTGLAENEAYVSYQGSFESHATNFGGGILFKADGTGGWRLEKWYPGDSLDSCLSLSLQGQARFLCLRGFTGQGETDTTLAIVQVPDSVKTVLAATDLRDTLQPEANCALLNSSAQGVLLGIDHLHRTATGFAVQIDYVPADAASKACAAHAFATAPPQTATLGLTPDGDDFTISPSLSFAPAETQ